MHSPESRLVTSYAPDKLNELFEYPFLRPQSSFYTDGDEMLTLPDDFEDNHLRRK